MLKDGWRLVFSGLIDESTAGQDVRAGQTVPDFGGGTATIIDFDPPRRPKAPGRVIVGRAGGIGRFFPGAYGCKIIPEGEAPPPR